ncbi:hypothetical protein QBC37DRAFT_370398 [Rhypophila decipiens]|uniref:Uncharacterized protein n=1 Tax=Rhypophila decipiens TaxID=261697 RepID=A0AAN6YF77_9PEZI|nr:hypothetical protein QBC37DRAFT_370398 [Rhypophila decipiens]
MSVRRSQRIAQNAKRGTSTEDFLTAFTLMELRYANSKAALAKVLKDAERQYPAMFQAWKTTQSPSARSDPGKQQGHQVRQSFIPKRSNTSITDLNGMIDGDDGNVLPNPKRSISTIHQNKLHENGPAEPQSSTSTAILDDTDNENENGPTIPQSSRLKIILRGDQLPFGMTSDTYHPPATPEVEVEQYQDPDETEDEDEDEDEGKDPDETEDEDEDEYQDPDPADTEEEVTGQDQNYQNDGGQQSYTNRVQSDNDANEAPKERKRLSRLEQ